MLQKKYLVFALSLGLLGACGGQTYVNGSTGAFTAPQQMPQQIPQQQQAYPAGQQGVPQISTPPLSGATMPNPASPGAPSGSSAAQPTVQASARPTATRPVAPGSVTPQPTATPAKAPATAKPQLSAAQQLLQKAVTRFQSLKSFKLTVEGYEANDAKGPTNLSFYMTALNGRAKLDVFKHTNSLYIGVKMGYQAGSDTISVRPGGALGFVKLDTQMNDERLLTPRGYRLDQIDAFAISQRLLGGKHAPKVLGKTQLNGRTIAILEYTRANDFDSKITRELLGIDMQDYFMRIHEMYEGDKLVFSLKIGEVQLDLPLSDKDLEI